MGEGTNCGQFTCALIAALLKPSDIIQFHMTFLSSISPERKSASGAEWFAYYLNATAPTNWHKRPLLVIFIAPNTSQAPHPKLCTSEKSFRHRHQPTELSNEKQRVGTALWIRLSSAEEQKESRAPCLTKNCQMRNYWHTTKSTYVIREWLYWSVKKEQRT